MKINTMVLQELSQSQMLEVSGGGGHKASGGSRGSNSGGCAGSSSRGGSNSGGMAPCHPVVIPPRPL
jgi:hypothetical protein